MKRIFITGATGFIGAAVTRRLVADGYEVAAVVRPESSTWRLGETVDRIRVIHGSFESPGSLEEPLADFRPDTVMHLAWSGVGRSSRNEPDQIRNNVSPSADLLTTAAKAGCRTFLGVGSQAEYGPSRELLREDSPTRPTTVYGAAKLATSVLLSRLAAMRDMRFAWLRLFSVYGPQDAPDTLVSYVTTELLAGRCPAVSRGDHEWDYLYIDDAARAFVAVGASQATGVINVASGDAKPLRETIVSLRDAIDPSLPIAFGAVPEPASGAFPLRANVDGLRQIGWRPTVDPRDGASRTVAWYRQRLIP